MRSIPLRAVACFTALAMPTTALAAPARRSLLDMRAEGPATVEPPPPIAPAVAPEAPPPAVTEPPAVAPAVTEPPIVATEVPMVEPTAVAPAPVAPAPAPIEPVDDTYIVALARAEQTRDLGAMAMVGSGVVTIGGVVLIIAGTVTTAAAMKDSDCGLACLEHDRKALRAGRVTAAGLVFSSLGALALTVSMAVYGVGQARVRHARQLALTFDPSSRVGGLTMRGAF